jgi:acetyltransferase-like isoleucine patch superfamily enzyme
LKQIALLIIFFKKAYKRILMYCLRPIFRAYGRNFKFDPFSTFSFENISVGNDVSIGPGACFLASRSSITIGNKVMFGPNVTVIGGDHNTSEIGKFMYDVKNKRPCDDLPVVIEDDVWVGADVIILKGIRIGRGSIVAAGSVVTKDVSPYSVVGGVPAQLIKKRLTNDEIRTHELSLYPPELRLSEVQEIQAIDSKDNKRPS